MAAAQCSRLVEVLYHFESNTTRGHIVNVQPGEQYFLVNDDDTDWCYVTKSPAASDGFYLPRTFIKAVTCGNAASRGNIRLSCVNAWHQNACQLPPGGRSGAAGAFAGHRHGKQGHGQGEWLLPESGPVPAALVHFRPFSSISSRLSNSIPVNLNLLPLIPEDKTASRSRFHMNNVAIGGDDRFSPAKHETFLPPILANEESPARQLTQYSPTSSLPEYNVVNNSFPRTANPCLDATTDGASPIYANVQAYVNSLPMVDSFEEPIRYLDDGWEERVDKSGRHFFYHPQTHKCTWKPPRSSVLIECPSYADNAQRDSEDKLSLNKSISGTSTDSGATGPNAAHQAGSETSLPLHDASSLDQNLDDGEDDQQLCRSCVMDSSTLVERDGPTEESLAVGGVSLLRVQSYDQKGPQKADKIQFSAMLLGSAGFSTASQKVIKTGTLSYCKLLDKGKRVKKHWLSNYVFLTQEHLIFYKDKKSSEKKENQYEPPLNVCELKKSRLRWLEDDKGRRKRVFQLSLPDGTAYLFCAEEGSDVNSWYLALSDAIAKLQPICRVYPVTKINIKPSAPRTFYDVTNDIRNSKADLRVAPPQAISETKQGLLERLVRFFRTRPSIESLKEKGIYKPEPVFGSSLLEICKREGHTVPKFVVLCTQIIEQRDLNTDGLYRMSGNLSQIQKIRCQVDQEKYSILEFESDVHVLTGALKLFFRELQEPLFPHTLVKNFMDAIKLQVMRDRMKAFGDAICKLPVVHHDTLDHLLRHLLKVAEHSAKNRMQIHNLAIVFGPTLFSTSPKDDKSDVRKKGSKKASHSRQMGNKSGGGGSRPDGVQMNSHLAFNMIMHGQIVEYMLKEHRHLFKK